LKYFVGPSKPKPKSRKAPAKKSVSKSASKQTVHPVSAPIITDSGVDNDAGLDANEDIDELDSSEDEDAPPKKKQKKKAREEEDAPEIEVTVYIFIIIPPPPTIHIRGKSTKPPPEQHRKRPPFFFDIDLSYEEFVAKVASATPCYPDALTRMMWKFEKPIRGDTRPLTTETSYAAMIKQLRDKSKDHIINIYMPPPNKLDNRPTFVCYY
jgi:hypothetical protein